MGELSKKIGERGEEIVETLFKQYFGFPNYRDGLSIECFDSKNHGELRGNKSQTHGIDGLVHYKSPLDEETLEIGYISVKHMKNPYPKYPRSKFKEHFIDLATGLECFKFSNHKSDIEAKARNVKKTRTIGVLFWLSNSNDSKEKNILEILSKSQLESLQIQFDKIIVVDNARLQFIVQTLETVKTLGDGEFDYVYPSTGLNLKANHNENIGKILPMEFLAYDILPLRYKVGNSVIFHLACREGISEESLVQVMSLSKTFDKVQAARKIVISFPDYNSQNHDDMVSTVKSYFEDQQFTEQISIEGQSVDFRNI
ncbi:hypothetical protein [Flagellimonas onchidii]|uniref:GapS4a family protein n=1 Tax=Flagellimonas onchidii TaxID=2562684 RepID=UPI0010A60749|nr:hypothetical protein [Allomuricauda onchidii]